MTTPPFPGPSYRAIRLALPPEERPAPNRLRGVPLAALLFVATFLTTTYAGYVARVSATLDAWGGAPLERLLERPSLLALGLPFSLALLSILVAHELGHYLACLWHRVDASPPYLIPAPTLVGTFGAFIRIREPLVVRHVLFDVGVAGPLAGFAVALAYLALGVAIADPARLSAGFPDFGAPPAMALALHLRFGYVPAPLSLAGEPVLFASWVGFLVTALNMLPVGQLDGGHVLTALIGRKARWVARAVVVALLALFVTTWWPGWLVWIVLLLLLGLRHPELPDPRPLDRVRVALGLLSFVVLALSVTPVPVRAW